MSSLEYDIVPPDSETLLESQRAYGYPTESAVADIVDNCITSGCKKIKIDFIWEREGSFVVISNDGKGMTEKDLVKAMKLGSKDPKTEREKGDLGRWGMGLKTASLSQARKLTVSTSFGNKTHFRCWDLDYIAKESDGEWRLLKIVDKKSFDRIKSNNLKGTTVLWENLDRTIDLKDPNKNIWNNLINKTEEHLAMVFHRFLSGKDKKFRDIKIYINQAKVKPWDPFLEDHEATQTKPHINLNKKVKVKGFILPHNDKFTDRSYYEKAGGHRGWNDHQGFYVYREGRLIVAGDWLGVGSGIKGWRKEIHTKLARIKIDIDNSLDEEWKIDVMKRTCQVPDKYREELKDYAASVRKSAEEVFRYRARGEKRKKKNPNDLKTGVWKTERKGKSLIFKINRSNDLIKTVSSSFSGKARKELKLLLRLIEEGLPLQDIFIEVTNKPDQLKLPFGECSKEEIAKDIKAMYELLRFEGKTRKQTEKILIDSDIWKAHKAILGALLAEMESL